jgi:prepilin-type N-terminal cleavage/methylation domain-containing protein
MQIATPPRHRRSGFSIAELVMVVVILGILASLASPKAYRVVTRSTVDRAAVVVAADLELAVVLARRSSHPVRLALESPGTYTLRDLATSPADSLRFRRRLELGGDAGLEALTFSRRVVRISPDGSTDGALTVTLGGGGQTRMVSLSAAGKVRTD